MMIRQNGLSKSSRCVGIYMSSCIILFTEPSLPQMIIRQQDETIDTIAGTLHTLQAQAGLMGQEIGEHNECVVFIRLLSMGLMLFDHFRMLTDLERNVDKTDGKLNDAMRRMKRFIRQTEGMRLFGEFAMHSHTTLVETKSGWCIVILIIVLMALLLAVILV